MKPVVFVCIGVLTASGCGTSLRPDPIQGFFSLDEARNVVLAPFIESPAPNDLNGFAYRQFNGWGAVKAENLSIVRRMNSDVLDATYTRYVGTSLYRISELWDKGHRHESDFVDALREERLLVSSVACPDLSAVLATLTQHVLDTARSGVPGAVTLVYTDSPTVRHYMISNGQSVSTEVSEVELESTLYANTQEAIGIVRRCATHAG